MNGVLIDAKSGYAQFVKDGQFQSWFSGADSLLTQTQRQFSVANGTSIQEILVRPTTYLSFSFALGLLAYLRQAALSLDRAPTSFCEAMRSYYESHGLPPPARVAAHIDAPAQPRASMVANLLQRLFRNSVSLNETELREVGTALRALETVLGSQVVESDSERIRIRLALSNAEELVRGKLGRYAGRVQRIEHLNKSPGLDLKPLGELNGANWPDSIS